MNLVSNKDETSPNTLSENNGITQYTLQLIYIPLATIITSMYINNVFKLNKKQTKINYMIAFIIIILCTLITLLNKQTLEKKKITLSTEQIVYISMILIIVPTFLRFMTP